ncbi:MAG: hypothetical protein AAF657_27790 [Acidobacteriota bacterium]
MFNRYLSRPDRPQSTFTKHCYVAFLISVAAANRSWADDEVVEFDPDSHIISKVLDFLRDLWAFMSEVIS